MRPIAVVLLVVAVIASGLAAFLAKHWMASSSSRRAAETETVGVLGAGRDIAAGTVLGAGDLRLDKWPRSTVSPRLVTATGARTPIPGYVGKITRFALTEGEPVTADGVFKQDTAGVLAGMLEPGMRAVSVPITNSSAVSGFVTPGDRVDVVLTRDMSTTPSMDGAHGGKLASDVVIQNVRVLGMDLNADATSVHPAVAHTATLEVTVQDAERLAVAAQAGTLSLALRRAGSSEIEAIRPMAVADLGPAGPRAAQQAAPRLTPVHRRTTTPRPASEADASIIVVHGDKRASVTVPAGRLGDGV